MSETEPHMGNAVKISVIVPTCDRPDQLLACLENLYNQSTELPYEIIVSDDGTKPIRQILAQMFPAAIWNPGPQKGPAANRNSAAAQASGDWLAFTDDDCLPDRTWLEKICDVIIETPDIVVVEGATDVDRPQQSLLEVAPKNLSGGLLWSCNFAIQRCAFNEIGGFDESFPYAAFEDIDFHDRVKKAGLETIFAPECLVIHPWRQHGGWNAWVKQKASLIHYMSKHPEAVHFRRPRFWVGSIIRTAQRELIGDGIKFRGRGLILPLQKMCFQSWMLWHILTTNGN